MKAGYVRYGALAVYGLVLAGGTAWIAARDRPPPPAPAAPGIVAARALPANHLLQAADLESTGVPAARKAGGDAAAAEPAAAAAARGRLAGRYLVRPVAARAPLGAADTAVQPLLPAEGAILVGLGAPRPLVAAGRINAGREAIACSGDRPVMARSFVVSAVVCPPSGELCTGFVRLGPDERELGALFGPGLSPRLSDRACNAPG